jgi:hypothetical protein
VISRADHSARIDAARSCYAVRTQVCPLASPAVLAPALTRRRTCRRALHETRLARDALSGKAIARAGSDA